MDGIIDNDLGWTGAFRYVFGNGTPTVDAIVQGIRDATNLYLSFEVNNDQQFDNEDVIVLALDPTGVPTNARLVHIYPVFAGTGAGTDGNPLQTQYFTNSASWTEAALPAGVNIKVTSAGVAPPGPVRWFVEIQLPRSAFNIPTRGDFGLYFNVMRANAAGIPIGQVNEKFWPTDAPAIGLDLLNTPPLNTWGNATLTGTCNGVSIDVSDITTNNSPTSKISFPPGSNVFTALVHNNTVDGAGTPIPANQVRATFRIANFGIPAFGDWTLIPTGNNPTSPPVNIGPNTSQALSTSPWTLTATQVAEYTAHPHQCILVELDSTAPDTVFVNRSAWRNMDFAPTSQFERQAEISARGYGPPPQGQNNHQFNLYVAAREETFRRPEDISRVDDRLVSQLTWVAHGYRDTGNFITIKNKRFAIVDHVGSFGHFVQHQGPVASWRQQLVGKGLKKIAENRYRLEVPTDGVATVATRVQAFEEGQKPPWLTRCFETKASLGGFTLVAGLVALGFIAYLPGARRE